MSANHRDKAESLAAAATRESLAVFVARAFRYLNAGEELVLGAPILAMCHALEEVSAGNERFLLTTAPPRFLKSFIYSICYPAGELGNNPSESIVCLSYSAELSQSLAHHSRLIMESDWYKRAFPKTRLDPKRANLDELRTTKRGVRFARSLGGPVTGIGGHKLVVDDSISAGTVQSEAERLALHHRYANVLPSRLNNPKKGAMIIVSQRLHVDDLPGRLIAEGGWRHLNLSMTAQRDEEIPIGQGKRWRRAAGTLLMPERFGEEEIARIKKQMGQAQYQAQYEQNPEAPGGALFKLADFGRFEPGKLYTRDVEQIVISWDMAMSAGEGANYSACTAWAIVGEKIYLVKAFRDHLSYSDLVAKVIKMNDTYCKFVPQPVTIIEKQALGVPVLEDLGRRGYNWVVPMPTERDKVTRAAQQSAKIEAGRVFLPTAAPWLAMFEDEVSRFPHGSSDDLVDTMTHALRFIEEGYWHHLMRDLSVHHDKRSRAQLIGGRGGIREIC